MIRRALIDLTPLRTSAVFRRLWIGRSLSVVGALMTTTAVLFQIYQATGSTIWSGMVGLAHAVPMVALGFVGGALADRGDRRRLVLVTTVGQFVAALALVGQAVGGGIPPAVLLVLVAVQTSFAAIGGPASRTFTARLLPAEQVGSGLALQGVSFQVALLAGPALAGLTIAGLGVVGCYAVDALTFLAAFYGVFGLPELRPEGMTDRAGWRDTIEGFRFTAATPIIRAALLCDLAATVFAMPVSLLPALNDELFAGDPRTLGLYLSAIGVGGLLGSVLSGAVTSARRPGRIIAAAAAVWGAALAGVGLSGTVWVGLSLLVVAGAADTVGVLARGTVIQLETPDALRGRVSAVESMVGMAGPDVGNLRGGLVAGWMGTRAAMAVGGLLCCLSVGLVAGRTPALTSYTMPQSARKVG